MVTSLNQSVPAREAGYEMVQYIAANVAAVAAGSTVQVKVGTLPAGSIPLWIHNRVATAFTGGTPLFTLGEITDAGVDNFVAALSEAAAGELVQPLTTIAAPLAADTTIYAQLSGGATAGSAYITIGFVKPLA